MQIAGEALKVQKCCGNCRSYRPQSMAGEPSYGVCAGPHVGQSRVWDDKSNEIVLVTKPIVNFETVCGHHN